jgi:putative ABC transport system permease protein
LSISKWRRFNIAGQNPATAIDEIVKVDGKGLRIIGVMKDFHYGRANGRNSRTEVVLRYGRRNPDFLNVKIQSTDLSATRAKIETIWKKFDQIHR